MKRSLYTLFCILLSVFITTSCEKKPSNNNSYFVISIEELTSNPSLNILPYTSLIVAGERLSLTDDVYTRQFKVKYTLIDIVVVPWNQIDGYHHNRNILYTTEMLQEESGTDFRSSENISNSLVSLNGSIWMHCFAKVSHQNGTKSYAHELVTSTSTHFIKVSIGMDLRIRDIPYQIIDKHIVEIDEPIPWLNPDVYEGHSIVFAEELIDSGEWLGIWYQEAQNIQYGIKLTND